jgi:RNA polymerase sigma-70 factor (ECF subfamily)
MLDDHEQERFMRFWISAQSSVAGYIHSLVRDHAQAKDLVQETALVLFRRFPDYDGERPFLAWALGIARFQVMGMRRDAARNLVTFDDDLLAQFTETWCELSPDSGDRADALRECLRELPQKAAHLIGLRYYEGLGAAEIATRTGTGNEGSVRVFLQRIRQQLRECVERRLRLEGGAL